jgi:hypothetical protein
MAKKKQKVEMECFFGHWLKKADLDRILKQWTASPCFLDTMMGVFRMVSSLGVSNPIP